MHSVGPATVKLMRAVMLQVPESLLAERRRLGADRWDEMWDGVLHMVPSPSGWHQSLGSELHLVLAPVAKTRGLRALYETAVHTPGRIDRDYRQPDLVFFKPEAFHDRGVVGAPELVVEILSPDDESYDKLPWYAALGTREVLIVDPITRAVDLFVLRDGKLVRAETARSEVLDATFARIDGPRLRVSIAGVTTEI
jgi:Uma2 family endonuclease